MDFQSSQKDNGYDPRDQPHSRQPGAMPSISHPYPPNYRSSPPPSQSYAYDNNRRQNHPSFSDANPYNPRQPSISVTAPAGGNYGGQKEGGDESVAVRGPKIGKKKYAENWTKEDEEAERVFLQKGMFDWKQMKDWRFWFRASWWYWYLILIIVCVLVALMTIYNDAIVAWLTPVANYLKDLPAGWTIPIAVLFILSFPPLFGQEIICLLVGAVWGLWVGFGIVTAGTMIGEIGNFYAFKYCLRSRAEKLEETNPSYACLAHIVREGGFFLAFVIRLSAVPGHFSTAVFATCGMNIFVFSAATILTMPKQLVIVYLGVIFVDGGSKSNTERIITYTTLAVAAVLTIWSAWYIYNKMNKARTIIWRRERLAEKAAAAEGLSVGGAQINRRVSYRAMLDQPNDDIEALSPMLPKDPYATDGDMRQAYNTPYELQQVPPQIQNATPFSPGSSVAPPSYRSPDSATPSLSSLPKEPGPSRRDSGTLPYPSKPCKISKKRTADQSSGQNASAYDLDGPEVRESRIDFSYGYTPSASTETFPMPKPLPADAVPASRVNRVSMYDPSAEEGYEAGSGEGGSYVQDGRQAGVGSGGRRTEGASYDAGASRGYQLTDPGYQR